MFLKRFIGLCLIVFSASLCMAQGSSCGDSNPFCSSQNYDFGNNTTGSAPSGANYGCLYSQPAPIWYYLQIGQSGTLQLNVGQTNSSGSGLDIDFAMWGPFNSLSEGCNAIMNSNMPPTQCSYSAASTETIGIGMQGGYSSGQSTPPPGQTGDIYIVLLTNYSQQAGNITLNQTAGTGNTDCNIVTPCDFTIVADTIISPTCIGYSDGEIQVGVTGDNDPWTYEWLDANGDSTGITSTNRTGLAAGTYTIQVTDTTLCSKTLAIDVVDPPQINATFTGLAINYCTDDPNVPLTAALPGGTYSGTGIINDSIFSPSTAMPGSYTITYNAIDTNGCTNTSSQTVAVNPMPVADFDVSPECLDSTSVFTDQSTVTSVNGSSIINWKWNFGDTTNNTSTNQNPTHVFNVDKGYNVQMIVKTNKGCADTIQKGTFIYPNPKASFKTSPVCLEESTHFIDSSTVPTSQYSTNTVAIWKWEFGDGNSDATQNPQHEYQTDGQFDVHLTVTTNNNCEDDTTITVTVHPLPKVSFMGKDTIGCAPLCPEVQSLTTINAPSTIDDLSWSLSGGKTYTGGYFKDCYKNRTGDTLFYSLTLTATSNEGCVSQYTAPNYITIYDKPTASFNYTPADPDVLRPDVAFHNESQDADTYLWRITPFGDTSVFEPSYKYPYKAGTFDAFLIAMNKEGCADTMYVPVRIRDEVLFYVPNSFTPDGDGINDVFNPMLSAGLSANTYHLTIFNRWGEVVFESYDVNKGWDGSFGQSHTRVAKQGTYIWRVTFKESMTDKHHTQTGSVTLLR